MAKVSAHGTEIGTIYSLTSARRYMSDSVVLINRGFGWKLHARVKPDTTAQDAFARASAKLADLLAARPAWAKYRAELHDMAGLGKRWKLHQAISMMPDDCDGVWSECCDGYGDNVSADVDEVGELCRAYQNMMREHEELQREKSAAMAD